MTVLGFSANPLGLTPEDKNIGRLVYDACRIGCGECYYYPIETPPEEGRTDMIAELLPEEGRIDTTVEQSFVEACTSQLKKKSFFKDFLWGSL
jgi:hypothetical protein